LRSFGRVVHVKNTSPNLQKLEDRSKLMIFVGYGPGSMAYRAYDPSTKLVHVMHDVMFEEEVSWHWGDNAVDSEFIVEYVLGDHPKVVIAQHHEEVPQSTLGMPVAMSATRSLIAATPSTVSPTTATPGMASTSRGWVLLGHAVMHATPPSGLEANIDTYHGHRVLLHFHPLQNIDEAGLTLGLVQQELDADLLVVDMEELASFQEAQGHEC
jgi:hypothetical protein